MMKKRTWKVRIRGLILVIFSGIGIAGVYFLFLIFGSNTIPFNGQKYFFIHTGAGYGEVLNSLSTQGIIRDSGSFSWVAHRLDYPRHIHAGRYRISSGMSNFSLVRLLRSGRQTPVRLVINKLRTRTDLVRLLSINLEVDSLVMDSLLSDQMFLQPFGLDTSDVMCMVIPDTYDFYWNTPAIQVFRKLYRAYQAFWTPHRRQLAGVLGLTPDQVTILASIVEEETYHSRDKPWIAGVYLNRLRRGMRLSSDPTVKFAMDDFSIKRIYDKYTRIISPFNTYLHPGLPPGPICTPSSRTLDSVLHAQSSGYLYFCARPDFSGYLVFAATQKEHLKNAMKYQHFLDSLHLK